ncbi:MerR family transcriptional regulator [Streptomyces sp. NPDC019645]|uniref:MerR family transcriptional regulator n=1 Tax=Streptomyces sp. NPDC019645 TaxID=3154786 RepID=UPI0033E12077
MPLRGVSPHERVPGPPVRSGRAAGLSGGEQRGDEPGAGRVLHGGDSRPLVMIFAVPQRELRFYEERGLLPPAAAHGHRLRLRRLPRGHRPAGGHRRRDRAPAPLCGRLAQRTRMWGPSGCPACPSQRGALADLPS